MKNTQLTAENLRNMLAESDDINFRELYINNRKDMAVTLIFVDGLVDQKTISDFVIKPLTTETALSKATDIKEIIDLISHGTLYFSSVKIIENMYECMNDILSGSAALVFDGAETAVTFDIKGFEKRSITEPTGENIIKGAKDAFVETLRVNTSMVRRKIKTYKLRIKETLVGKQSLTPVAVVYLEGTADQGVVDEIHRRLKNIDVDGAVVAGFIEEYIIDSKLSLFPQVLYTERVDKFCSNILDGMVGLLIDGMPVSYTMPAGLNMFLQAPEDYAENYLVSSMIRLFRYFSAVLTVLLPGLYIALTTFHQEMIPTELAISIISSKEGVPFTSFIEILLMLLAYDLIIEAGLRLPRNIGQAVSIVGAIVVGQAAVSARFVSPAVVVIIAITGIAGFTMPNQDFSNALRVCRFGIILLSAIAGLLGLAMGLVLLVYHLCTLEVFGMPYLSPYVGNEGKGVLQDTVFRLPLFTMKKLKTGYKHRKREKIG